MFECKIVDLETPKLRKVIVNIGDFLSLLETSKYKCYFGWFKEHLEDYCNYSTNTNIPLLDLLIISESVLAYEEREGVNDFCLFVEKNLKGL